MMEWKYPEKDEYKLEMEPIFLSEPDQVKVLGEELIERVSKNIVSLLI